MKTLTQLFPYDGFYRAEDFINRETGAVDHKMLAYDLYCHLRNLDPRKPNAHTEALGLIDNYFGAVANAARGKIK